MRVCKRLEGRRKEIETRNGRREREGKGRNDEAARYRGRTGWKERKEGYIVRKRSRRW